jgi:hypothetical protein
VSCKFERMGKEKVQFWLMVDGNEKFLIVVLTVSELMFEPGNFGVINTRTVTDSTATFGCFYSSTWRIQLDSSFSIWC